MSVRPTPFARLAVSPAPVVLFAALLATALTSGGCMTRVTAREVTSDDDDHGLRYFLPAPYLVIREGPNKHWDAEIKMGVDRSREFYVQPNAVFAAANTEITFNDDGTLKSFKLNGDSTTVPAAVVAALKDIELEKLRLQKEAMENQPPADGGDGDGGTGTSTTTRPAPGSDRAGAPTAPNPNARYFAVYQIRGTTLKPIDPGSAPETGAASGTVIAPVTAPAAAGRNRSRRPGSPAATLTAFPGITGDDRVEAATSPQFPNRIFIHAKDQPPLSNQLEPTKFQFFTDAALTQRVTDEAAIRDAMIFRQELSAFEIPKDKLNNVKGVKLLP
jgi:hypothetical protein